MTKAKKENTDSEARRAAAVIELRSQADLDVFNAMVDRHEKGTIATVNTVTAFGGDKHALDHVLEVCGYLRRQAALQGEILAPKGDDAVSGTPIGDALDTAKSSGIAWDAAVPSPRPEVGQWLRLTSGPVVGITRVVGYNVDRAAFVVEDDAGVTQTVVHSYNDGVLEWWLLGSIMEYGADRVTAPPTESTAQPFTDDALAGTTTEYTEPGEGASDEKPLSARSQRRRTLAAKRAADREAEPAAEVTS